MKSQTFIIPALVAVLAGGTGWYLGQRPTVSEAVTTPETSAEPAAAKKPTDGLDAPAGGFDPAYVKVAAVSTSEVPDSTPISGKLAFDAEHLFLVSSRVAGRLDRILVFEGARVAKGQAVAELYSPDWISAQNELLLARNTVRTLASSNQKDLLEDARATQEAARNRLAVLGASPDDIARIERSGVVENHLTLRAAIAGLVTKRNMDPGAFLNVGDNFMTISDMDHLWFIGNIYEQDYAKARLGAALELHVAARPDTAYRCNVNLIGTNVDPQTHTLPIRCSVANDGSLRPELFVAAMLTTGRRQAVVLPNSAIVAVRQNHYVIVETAPGHYVRKDVSITPLPDGRVEATAGLRGGERVVMEGSTLINEAMSNQ